MFDTYITITVKENSRTCLSVPFDIYCTKVTFEPGCAHIFNIIGVSRYGLLISEDKDYEIKSINPFSYKMESLTSVHNFIVDDKGVYHRPQKKPLLLTFQSNREKNKYIEMVSNGIIVDFFGKWNHNIDYKHVSSHPDFDDWRKLDSIEWRLIAVECLCHQFNMGGKSPYGLEKDLLGFQKEFNFYINLWDRVIRITYNGDRAISCIQSDHDGGFEQRRQLYYAVFSHYFKTKRDLMIWLRDFKDDLFLLDPNNQSYLNLSVNLEQPILNHKIEFPKMLKDCHFTFNENNFVIHDGMEYTEPNP